MYILGLAETWLKESEVLTLATIARKEAKVRTIGARMKGGLAITYRLETKMIWKQHPIQNENVICIDVNEFFLILIYVNPENQKSYVEQLYEILSSPMICKRKLLIMGDFNVHENKGNTCDFKLFEENVFFFSHLGESSTDQAWGRGLDCKCYVSLEYTMSDHNMIVAEVKLPQVTEKNNEVERNLYTIRHSPESKKYSKAKVEKFVEMAKKKSLELRTLVNGSVDVSMDRVHSTLISLHKQCFDPSHIRNIYPLKNKKNLNLTKETLEKIKLRKRLKTAYYSTKNEIINSELDKI